MHPKFPLMNVNPDVLNARGFTENASIAEAEPTKNEIDGKIDLQK